MKTRYSILVTLSVFLLFGIGSADSSPSKENPKGNKESAQSESKSPTEIKWLKYDEGLKMAKEEGKKVFIEFTAKWCGWCRKMRATTFKEPEIITAMSDNYIAVSVDGESRDSLNIDGWITSEKGVAREYRVSSYPTYWFLTSDAKPIAPLKGYRDKNTLGNILDYLKDDLYKTVKFEDYLKEKQKK